MKYLFFDIECCNGDDMCSLGYVIVDNKFNIIEKKDILINPEAEFREARNGFMPDRLSHNPTEYLKFGNFKENYYTFKNLMNNKNIRILGHSTSNDIEYLLHACKRYKLPIIHIESYDTQKIYANYQGNNKRKKLEVICGELNIDISNYPQHDSCNDAIISMIVIKEICKRQNIELVQLLEKNKNTLASTFDYKYYKNQLGARKNLLVISENVKFSNVNTIELLEYLYKKTNFGITNKVSEASIYLKGHKKGLRDKYIERHNLDIKTISLNEFKDFLLSIKL